MLSVIDLIIMKIENCLLGRMIKFEVEPKNFYNVYIKDIKVVAEENVNFKPFTKGETIRNYILQFPYIDKETQSKKVVVRIYATLQRSKLVSYMDIIFDTNSTNYSEKVIEKTINLLKSKTWTIEKSGSIKTGTTKNKKGEAVRKLLKKATNMLGEIDYKITIGKTTDREKELLIDIYNNSKVYK